MPGLTDPNHEAHQRVAGAQIGPDPIPTETDLALAYARAARATSAGERRSWEVPEAPDAGPTATQIAGWLRQLLAVPWCLDETSVDAVCELFDRLLAGGVLPGRVEVLCHEVHHRRPTVYLAVSAWNDGALQPPRIARVDAVVVSAS